MVTGRPRTPHLIEEVPDHLCSVARQLYLGVKLYPKDGVLRMLECSNDVTTVPHHQAGGRNLNHRVSVSQQHLHGSHDSHMI